MPPRKAQEAEQMTPAVGKGELTGNPDRETLYFPKAERPISEITSISQVIFVLVPEDISELINEQMVSEHKRVMWGSGWASTIHKDPGVGHVPHSTTVKVCKLWS